MPISLRAEYEREEPRPTSPLKHTAAIQVLTVWSWVLFSLDLIYPTFFYVSLQLGFANPLIASPTSATKTSITWSVALRDFFLVRVIIAALTMGHVKLLTHHDSNSQAVSTTGLRLRALAVAAGVCLFGLVTLLIIYLLLLENVFGSDGLAVFASEGEAISSSISSSSAEAGSGLDTDSNTSPDQFGYLWDCMSGTNKLVSAVDCTVLQKLCFDPAAASAATSPDALPPLRKDCPGVTHLPPDLPRGSNLVSILSYSMESSVRNYADTWTQKATSLLTAQWLWSWDYWANHWSASLSQ